MIPIFRYHGKIVKDKSVRNKKHRDGQIPILNAKQICNL